MATCSAVLLLAFLLSKSLLLSATYPSGVHLRQLQSFCKEGRDCSRRDLGAESQGAETNHVHVHFFEDQLANTTQQQLLEHGLLEQYGIAAR